MSPLRVRLVNMPFSAVELPSIALTQLQAVLAQRFGAAVEVEVLYLSHDVCRYLGLDLYRGVCDEAPRSGLGDWCFRDLAFPGMPDDAEAYRRRFFPARDERQQLFSGVLAKRPGLAPLFDRLIAHHRLADADLVGFTSMFDQNLASFALARELKRRRPELLTVLGGANCESPMGEEIARRVEPIDYVFSGPALRSFPAFVGYRLAGDLAPAERLNGVFTHASCRAGRPPVGPIGDELAIDAPLPLAYGPYLDAFEAAFAGQPVAPILLFETSRGCWWGERAHCTFCGLNGSTMSYRPMQPARARAQFAELFSFAPRARRFNCVDNIMPKDYPREVFAHLEPPPGTAIFYEVKADLTADELRLLARAGVRSIQPGIEALNSSTLTRMRKGTTAVKNVHFLKLCRSAGVTPEWNLLVGFPGEEGEVFARYLEDIPRLVHLTPPSGVYPVRFDRFSPYFVQAAHHGLDLQPLDYYRFLYPFDDAALAGLAYYFADRNVTAPYFQAMAQWIGRLRQAHAAWSGRWASEPPLVCFERPGATTVLDTRSGAPLRHEVGDAGRALLTALDEPTTLADLPARLAGGLPFDLAPALAALRARDLIFEEGHRLVSLVFLQPPAPGGSGERALAEIAEAMEAAPERSLAAAERGAT
jgi:ribosomal peptide maturation radical SAM protein 1